MVNFTANTRAEGYIYYNLGEASHITAEDVLGTIGSDLSETGFDDLKSNQGTVFKVTVIVEKL